MDDAKLEDDDIDEKEDERRERRRVRNSEADRIAAVILH